MRRCLLVAALAVVTGCPQDIRTQSNQGGGGDPSSDAGSSPDAVIAADLGTPADSGALLADSGTVVPDAGCRQDCLRAIPETAVMDVRQTLEILVSGASGPFAPCDDPPVASRDPQRPALAFSDIEYTLTTDPANGRTEFAVTTVPPWFFETTFAIAICGPTDRVTARVTVRGNVLVAASYAGVFAFSSDGIPAEGKNQLVPNGKLIDDSIARSTALRLLPNGNLLVFDEDSRPARIAEYDLTSVDNRLRTFAHRAADLNGAGELVYDNVAIHSIARFSDGSIAMADSPNSGSGAPRVMVWNADGTFAREILGADEFDDWFAVAEFNGELLVTEQNNVRNQVMRIDPDTGIAREFTISLNQTLYALEPIAGQLYVAGMWRAGRVSDGGGLTSFMALPDDRETWRSVIGFGADRVLVSNTDVRDSGSIAVIENHRFVRWLRPAGNRAGSLNVYAISYMN